MSKPQLILFDLDGTLVDSLRDIVTSANLLLAEYDLPALTAERITPYIGRGVRYLIASTLEEAGGTVDADEAIARYRQLYAAHALDETAPYPGVRETLTRMRNLHDEAPASVRNPHDDGPASMRNLHMAVISNKPERACRRILEALELDSHFFRIAGGDTYEEMKPSPLPLLRVIELAGADPAATWMVGDSVYDIEAGKRAGVRTAAVSYGFQEAEKLKALDPDVVVSAFEDLLPVFAGSDRIS